MVTVQDLTYHIGSRVLYKDLSLHIKPKDKIGLIGLNGTGKSTLLKLLAGKYSAENGTITRSNDCSIGLLDQDQLSYHSNESILSVAMEAFEKVLEIERNINDLIKNMEENYHEDQVHKLTKLQEKFETMEGYKVQAKAEEVLEGMGFDTSDLSRPLSEFSGGWKMRVVLARLLLQKPSLLLLDEPTNHLDLPSIEWFENYLLNYDGAVIIVSHDRRFLNSIVNRIAEINNKRLDLYEGNYDFYLEEKAQRQEIQKNAYQNQQQMIKQTERFINRFRAKASKARQVQSRIKALERMDKVEDIKETNESIYFKFNLKERSGRQVINLSNISKSYNDIEIFSNTSAQIHRGDKIALIGANGKGKSTLLRIINGNEPFEGKREEGYNLRKAFYAQHQLESLNPGNQIIEELKQTGSHKTEMELRTLLGCFLFNDDDVFKKIKVLSGGEKSRVALAKTLISEANFLILDEPTNHLDFLSENILVQALQQYEGSCIMVSHNRYFISEIANKIWYIENKQIKEYPGTYPEFDYWWKNIRNTDTQKEKIKKEVENNKKSKSRKKIKVPDSKEQKSIKEKIELLEEKINKLELKKSVLEEEMGKPEVFSDHEKLFSVNQEYEAIKTMIIQAEKSWDELVAKIK